MQTISQPTITTSPQSGGSNDKLRNFLNQIRANTLTLKSEQSDLLLEYKDDENSTASCRAINAMDDISSTESVDTLSLFNLLTNNTVNNNTNNFRHHQTGSNNSQFSQQAQQQQQMIDLMSSEGASDEKMIKMLIKLLVKSCRIFDVATQKTDTRISYWRYANPIVALIKQRSVPTKTKPSVSNAAVQTGEETNNNNNDDESTLNDSECNDVKTIIEANKKNNNPNLKSQSRSSLLARSIIELVNESIDGDNKVEIFI